jgi:tRNA pseudouridine38-40 synthase
MYRYTICAGDVMNPLLRNYAALVPYGLNLAAMRRAAAFLVGRHDFKSFQASGSPRVHSRRTIKRLDIKKRGSLISIEIEADGFLYNMVRSIIGTLIEVGRGKMGASRVKEILAAKDRRLAGPTAPAKGLCLMRVNY